jgi:prolyl 4-hydroxylase
MQASSVVDNLTGKSVPSKVRTSTGTFFSMGEDEVIQRIEKRVAQVTMIPQGKGDRGCLHVVCIGQGLE